ncbi:MAG TPA: DegT/DnrJ/EryC1/StrS family aminotransferase [Chloroflexota bacterium]|nr:DegT/DnrJ/EryC1/StrS family aminotransferase [Chloroflexota bacterium]
MSALRSKPARLAVAGGTPVRSAPFPAWPVWEAREERALLEVLRSGRWGSHAGGGRVQDFCERFATVQGVRHAVAVSNGTAALEVALRAVGVAPLDEVILPPYTFVASATAVLSLGAIPVFCDVLPHTYLIDPADAARKVTGRTRAILPVHLAGQPCDMDAVMEVARRHNLKVVEDAAQAPGATWRGRGVGAIGHAGAISFQSSKNLTSGEGGAVVTDDPQVAERAWSIANVGRVPSGAWYQHEVMGSNFRLTEFQGALPVAERACSEEGVWLPQQVLLADEADLKDVVEAVRKVQQVASRG